MPRRVPSFVYVTGALLATLLALAPPSLRAAAPTAGLDALTACTGAPSYPCGGVNVGGWEPWWEWIARVEIDAIDNASGKDSYRFFDQAGPAQLAAGSSVRVKLTPGVSYPQYETYLYWTVYIDYNRDGDFDDAGERVLQANGLRKSVDQTITIPTAVNPGCTRIRVTLQRDQYAGACESISFGEFEDYLAVLSGGGGGGGGGGQTICADRTITDNVRCGTSDTRSFFSDIVGNVSGDTDFFRVQNGRFVEYTDGTARLTARFVNTGNVNVVFDAVVDFSGRTETAPGGSPKQPLCNQSYNGTPNFYYYPTFSGTLTGRHALAGGVITVSRKGEAFQVGVGANLNELGRFGASGWLMYAIQSQPTGAATFHPDKPMDFNFRLSGTRHDCFQAPPTSITLQCQANVTIPQIATYGADIFVPVPQANTTCPQGGLTFSYSVTLPANRTIHVPVGTTTITVTATDACGNSATCSYTVTVTATPPGGGTGCSGNTPNYPCGGANVGGWEPWWEWIARVQFAGLDNASGKDQYRYFATAGPAQINPGQTSTLTITPGLSYPQYVTNLYYTAYIDWNRDGDFDDAGEEVLRKNATSQGVSTQVTAPANAVAGPTRLRVHLQRDAYAGPCEVFSFGETEDYKVCIGGGGTTTPTGNLTVHCPTNVTLAVPAGQTTVALQYTAPTASTTCTAGGLNVTRTSGPAPGAQRGAGAYTVVYTVTDACGNSKVCTLTITVTAAPPQGPTRCADRDATNTVSCGTGDHYSFFGDFVRNVSGDGDYFAFTNGRFEEFSDGTARLTGLLVNTHRSDVRLVADVTFSGRTTSAPAGSPKSHLCGGGGQSGSYYYYTQASGQLTGTDHLAGGQLQISRTGPAFQVGVGANVNDANLFGASGWFGYQILSQPSGAPTFITGQQLDFNIRLSGSATACVPATGNGGGGGSSNCNSHVLFVVGNTSLSAADHAVRARLQAWGYTVTVVGDSHATAAHASGKGLVVISSSVASTNVGTTFTHVAVPVLVWESWLYDDLKMTGPSAGHDYGEGWGFRELTLVNAHPIGAGLSGTRVVVNSNADYRWGKPSSAATIVAHPAWRAHEPTIFAYDAGDQMVGKVAPAKRIGWYFNDHTAADLTSAGWLYFKNAVEWATSCSGGQLRIETPIQLDARASYLGVDIVWTTATQDGEDAYYVERQDASGDWVALKTLPAQPRDGAAETYTFRDEAPVTGTNLYRVRSVSTLVPRASNERQVTFAPFSEQQLFPNPATDVVNLVMEGLDGYEVEVSIVNALGQVVYRQLVTQTGGQAVAIPVAGLQDGGYFVNIQTGGVSRTVPLVIIH